MNYLATPAAGRRVRHRRHDGHGHHDRGAGHRPGRHARLPARHLADVGGDRAHDRGAPRPGDVRRRGTPTCSRATTAGSRCPRRPGTRSRGTRARPTCASPRTSTACDASSPRCRTSTGARVLAKLGDSVTTDHISPAGSIKLDSPAGRYLTEHGVERRDFNSYGSRRGNHEVMIRGTFANIRLRNQLARRGRGRLHRRPALAGQAADHDLRRLGRLPGGRRPARGPRRQGVRLGLLARLGRQGHRAARRQGGHRRSRTSASTART